MGLDGGTIISRNDVLRGSSMRLAQADGSRSTRGGAVSTSTVYKEPEITGDEERAVSWTTCSISEQPLQEPIVADELGRLYNKDAVLEFLLCRRAAVADAGAMHRFENHVRVSGTAFEHLRSLKDVFQLRLTRGDALGGASSSGGGAASGAAPGSAGVPWVCPITLLPAGGPHAFAALRPCGHVFAERAIAYIPDSACPSCSKAFQRPGGLITLCPSKERASEQRAALLERRRAEREARESSKAGRAAKRKREG